MNFINQLGKHNSAAEFFRYCVGRAKLRAARYRRPSSGSEKWIQTWLFFEDVIRFLCYTSAVFSDLLEVPKTHLD